jgi:cation transport ATPase
MTMTGHEAHTLHDETTKMEIHPPPAATPGHKGEDDHGNEHSLELVEVLRVVFVVLAAAAVWFHLWEPFHRVSVIGLAATLIGGYPIFKEAFENIVERRMTMELSMTIALVSALAIGEFFTALVITAFVLAAEILEGLTVGRGRRAIQDMLDFLPQRASLLRGDKIIEVSTETILPGEIVVIRPGSRIPVDGEVTTGHSFVEQAAITGEPMPSEKVPGSEVYAGTFNQAGILHVRTDRLGKDTAFGKIIEAVERAEQSRAPIQKDCRQISWISCVLRTRRGIAHICSNPQHSLYNLRDHRRGRMRHRRRHSAGRLGSDRPRSAPRFNHQGRDLPRGPGPTAHGLPG